MSNFRTVTSIYLAGPWFNQSQVERYEDVLDILRIWQFAAPGRSIYVPRDHPCAPSAGTDERVRIYDSNVQEIRAAEAVVAITDEKDVGTIYELGYAARVRDVSTNHLPLLVGVALSLGDRPFNLMLAVGLDATCRTVGELGRLLIDGIKPPVYSGVIE